LGKSEEPRPAERAVVPLDFFSLQTQAISGTDVSALQKPGDRLRLVVQMSDATVVRAYLLAYERFESAGRGQDAQIALVEVLTWLDVLASRPKWKNVKGLPNVRLLQYVRGRCHHQLAFAIFEPDESDAESGLWCWLPSLPPADRKYQRPKLEERYARKLAGRPVLDTLKLLEGPIRRLSTS
jgi:hypothetical protein